MAVFGWSRWRRDLLVGFIGACIGAGIELPAFAIGERYRCRQDREDQGVHEKDAAHRGESCHLIARLGCHALWLVLDAKLQMIGNPECRSPVIPWR